MVSLGVHDQASHLMFLHSGLTILIRSWSTFKCSLLVVKLGSLLVILVILNPLIKLIRNVLVISAQVSHARAKLKGFSLEGKEGSGQDSQEESHVVRD